MAYISLFAESRPIWILENIIWPLTQNQRILAFTWYRVYHIEMCDCKRFWGVEGSMILLIFLWRHVQEQWAFDFWPLYFIQVPKAGLQNMPSKKNQQDYWSFHPSEPFTIAHFNVRHPVCKDLNQYIISVRVNYWSINHQICVTTCCLF